jgi:hypothetical protein
MKRWHILSFLAVAVTVIMAVTIGQTTNKSFWIAFSMHFPLVKSSLIDELHISKNLSETKDMLFNNLWFCVYNIILQS